MSAYSAKERYLAEILRKFPVIKKIAKLYYQKINYLIHNKKYSFQCAQTVKMFEFSKQSSSFFGYYDKSPINSTGRFIIFHSKGASQDQKKLSSNVDIVCYDTENETYRIIDTILAYNWQQGCRLQWLDHNQFVFNNFENGDYVAKIYNIELMQKVRTVDKPIYDCYSNRYALSVSFERLAMFNSDYGYFCKSQLELKNNQQDGIWQIDLNSGKYKLIYSIHDAEHNHPLPSMENADHLFNHLMISPDGTKFIFIHRWFTKSKIRYDRLVMFDLESKKVTILVDDGMVSHCNWYDNNRVAGYLKYKTSGYFIINTLTGEIDELSPVLKDFPDGHLSFYQDFMLFDTYPDKSRMQSLYLLDLKKQKLNKLGEFLAPFKFYGDSRCDLHPRWSCDGKSIYLDSTHEGIRKLYEIPMN